MPKPFIKIKESDLSKFNSGDKIQFNPYFIYDGTIQNVGTVTLELPKFPSLLNKFDLIAQRTLTNAKDIKYETTTEFRVTSYKKPSNTILQIFLEKEWYFPRNSSNKIIEFKSKTGVTNLKSASTLLPGSMIQFTASPSNVLKDLNNLKMAVNKVINSPQAINQSIPSTGSVCLEFNLPTKGEVYEKIKLIPNSNNFVTVNTSTAAIRDMDYASIESYDTWRLSIPKNYLKTLNNNKYVKDVVIFAYNTFPKNHQDADKKYLIDRLKMNGLGVNITDPTKSPFLNIRNYYLDSQDIATSFVEVRIYTKILGDATNIKFFATIIRFIDESGTGNFLSSTAKTIFGQDWVPMTVIK